MTLFIAGFIWGFVIYSGFCLALGLELDEPIWILARWLNDRDN